MRNTFLHLTPPPVNFSDPVCLQDSISVGDEVVEANGTAVTNLSVDEANQAIRQHTPASLSVRSNVSAYLAARDTFYVRYCHFRFRFRHFRRHELLVF